MTFKFLNGSKLVPAEHSDDLNMIKIQFCFRFIKMSPFSSTRKYYNVPSSLSCVLFIDCINSVAGCSCQQSGFKHCSPPLFKYWCMPISIWDNLSVE